MEISTIIQALHIVLLLLTAFTDTRAQYDQQTYSEEPRLLDEGKGSTDSYHDIKQMLLSDRKGSASGRSKPVQPPRQYSTVKTYPSIPGDTPTDYQTSDEPTAIEANESTIRSTASTRTITTLVITSTTTTQRNEDNSAKIVIGVVVPVALLIIIIIALIIIRCRHNSNTLRLSESKNLKITSSIAKGEINSKSQEKNTHEIHIDKSRSEPEFINGGNSAGDSGDSVGNQIPGINADRNISMIYRRSESNGGATSESAPDITVYSSIDDRLEIVNDYTTLDNATKYSHSYASFMELINDPKLRPPMPLPRRTASEPLPYYSLPANDANVLSNQNTGTLHSAPYLELIGEAETQNQPLDNVGYPLPEPVAPETYQNSSVTNSYVSLISKLYDHTGN